MGLDRRRFLTTLGATAAAVAVGRDANAERHAAADCDVAWGVLVDTVVCIGCRKCEWACEQEHKLLNAPLANYDDKSVFAEDRRPDDKRYTVVNEYRGSDQRPHTIKMQCMHCNQPACVSSCIVGALTKDPQGPVVYDAWKCIGCRYCMVACPFQIPAYEYHNALTPEVRKCTFCHERLARGEQPACVAICPNEALTFGRREDLIEVARARIRHNPGKYIDHIYGEHEVGGTAWLYLLASDVASTGLPELGSNPIPPLTESIQHGIFRSFVPPLALYALLGLVMYSTRRNGKSEPTAEDDVGPE